MAALPAELVRTDAKLRRAAHALAICGVVVLLLQAFSIVADAGSRWIFNAPIPGMEDVNGLIIAVTVASFFPALHIERANITVNLVGRAAGARPSAWLDVFGHLLTLVFIVLLAWQYFRYTVDLGAMYTVILELPRQPAALLVSVLLGASAMLQAFVLLVAVRKAAARNAR